MSQKIFQIVTHVATQLTNRWLAIDDRDLRSWSLREGRLGAVVAEGESLTEVTFEDWEDFLIEERSDRQSRLPWLRRLEQLRPCIVEETADALCRHIASADANGASLIALSDESYPPNLRAIAKPPLLLTCLGDVSLLQLPRLAAIGSRQATVFALQQCIRLGQHLASEPVCVVSGGAIGCDIAVHQGMLSSSASIVRACVVFAGGLGCLYPRRHEFLFEQLLIAGGVLVSERLWWQSSQPRDFPVRNRIVSGISDAVVVMQAAEESGALITADEALEQGRDVFVLEHPGPDVRALGSHQLIADGAVPFACAEEFLQKLGWFQNSQDFINDDKGACHSYRNIGTVKVEQMTY